MKPPDGLRHWPEYRYLFGWLQVATKGLSDESRARIREEITDHFHQGIAEGLRAGLTEDAAAEQAVAGLGSPKSARRAFRRTYLTKWQATIMRGFVDLPKPAPSSRLSRSALGAKHGWRGSRKANLCLYTYMVLAVATMFVWDRQRMSPREWQLCIGIVALMVVATIVRVAVPRIFRSGRERMAIALGASADLALWAGFLIAPGIGPFGRATDLRLRFWLVGLLFVLWAATHLPLLLKLGRRREAT